MSGPALKQYDWHRSIHEAAFGQVKEMTRMVKELHRSGWKNQALEGEKILLEHWKDHIISHADAEEAGLYAEKQKENPKLEQQIIKLTRDHDLLRVIIDKIEISQEKKSPFEERSSHYDSLLIINEIHSRDEETSLLKGS